MQLALWDTACVYPPFHLTIHPAHFSIAYRGQEEYERLRPLSYAKSHVILIAFAIDAADTLENVQHKWIDEVRSICGHNIPIILVGCKSDLRPLNYQPSSSAPNPGRGANHNRTSSKYRGGAGGDGDDEPRFVTTEQGQRVANQIGARAYKECSALRMDGVDDVFEAATRASMLLGDAGVRSRTRDPLNEEDAGGCCVIC